VRPGQLQLEADYLGVGDERLGQLLNREACLADVSGQGPIGPILDVLVEGCLEAGAAVRPPVRSVLCGCVGHVGYSSFKTYPVKKSHFAWARGGFRSRRCGACASSSGRTRAPIRASAPSWPRARPPASCGTSRRTLRSRDTATDDAGTALRPRREAPPR